MVENDNQEGARPRIAGWSPEVAIKVDSILSKVYAARENDRKEAFAQLKRIGKLLLRQGYQGVIATFDGSGDDGDISGIYLMRHAYGSIEKVMECYDPAYNAEDVNDTCVVELSAMEPIAEFKEQCVNLDELIEQAARLSLPGGWELEHGSYGRVGFCFVDDRVSVDCICRSETSEYHEFEL